MGDTFTMGNRDNYVSQESSSDGHPVNCAENCIHCNETHTVEHDPNECDICFLDEIDSGYEAFAQEESEL